MTGMWQLSTRKRTVLYDTADCRVKRIQLNRDIDLDSFTDVTMSCPEADTQSGKLPIGHTMMLGTSQEKHAQYVSSGRIKGWGYEVGSSPSVLCSTVSKTQDDAPEASMGSTTPRERLLNYRDSVAGRVVIPDHWGGESHLLDWVDSSAVNTALQPAGLNMARAAMFSSNRISPRSAALGHIMESPQAGRRTIDVYS